MNKLSQGGGKDARGVRGRGTYQHCDDKQIYIN